MGSSEPNRVFDCAVMAAALLLCPEASRADQGGSSFWFPGQFASLAAVQQTPGWALGVIYYHSSVTAAGSAAAARQILAGGIPANVNVSLNLSLIGRSDLVALAPTYTFATPVLGGQLVAGIAGQYGKAAASIAGTLTAVAGPMVVTRSGVLEGSLVSYGDLAPFAQLLWSHGVNNYMAYVTGNIPVGDYNPLRIPNIGLGHGAIDAGGGYTYLNPATGNEFSGVAGFTYNFREPRHAVPQRNRFPLRLGRIALSHQAAFRRRCRLRLPANHRRFRPESDPRRLQITCFRCRPADRI